MISSAMGNLGMISSAAGKQAVRIEGKKDD